MQGIEWHKVCLKRHDQTIFTNLSLNLREDRIGIIGSNGAGKSSMAQLCNGLLQPSEGQIMSHGKNTKKGPHALSRLVGYVFQNPDHQIIFPTVVEELGFSLQQCGYNTVQAHQNALDYLTDQDRLSWADRSVMALSEGQKQWLCIHSILVMAPRTLILDEPFSALDLASRHALSTLLKQLTQQIILITHELEPLADFERILWLESGDIMADGPPKQVLPEYKAFAHSQMQPDLLRL